MRKQIAILCVALLVVTLVDACKPPGLLCTEDKDCCAPMVCNPWAGRCTKKPAPPAPPAPSSSAAIQEDPDAPLA